MKISPHSWQKLSELLDTAMEMQANERNAWLESLSRTLPPDEFEPLKAMLAQQARLETNDILRAVPDIASALTAETSAPTELRPGGEIGGYRLLRELGRGGMASVWLAEQIDGRLKRQVALKFPNAGPQQRQIAKRFLVERDILAKLEHQNIARIYDADAANLDRPFLVLEFVDGIPIDEFCRTKQLSLEERLTLFRQVFDAVQFAHMRLVIHRDLKPSNILVTSGGVVRLLDFGIAKVLVDDKLSDNIGANASLTEMGDAVLTPNFASPEQITGGELTTASDVYSLGIVLYELLTGARPYRLKRESRGSLEDAIAAADVIVPSEAAAAGHSELDSSALASKLRGDLDTILLKALKKKPDERYPTVAAFADDIERYLRHEPVLARADSRWYRIRKFVGRNRLAVAATLAVILSLSIGLSTALWQLHAARVAQKRAEDVKEFIASLFRSADPFFTGNRALSAVDLLALAKQRIDSELQNQPDSAIELLNIVGESQSNLEEDAAARATLEGAISLGERKFSKDDSRTAQARAKLGAIYATDQDFERAKPFLAESIPILRAGGPKAARALSNALQMQAYIDVDEGNADLAIAESQEAYRVVLATLGARDSETILSKRNWAQQLLQLGRVKESLPLAQQAFDEARSAFNEGQRGALMAETEGLYGRALVEMDELKPGMEHLRSAIEQSNRLYGPKSAAAAAFRSYLMRAQLRYGDMDGVIASATASYEAADSERLAARPLTSLGDVYHRARKMPQAATYLQKAVDVEKRYDTGKGSWLPVAQATYASTLLYLGRTAEAKSLLEENARIVGDSKDALTMPHWSAMGLYEAMLGRWRESEQAYRHLLERTTDSMSSARWKTIALNGIGVAQLELGKLKDAEASLREADKAARYAYVNMTPSGADALVNVSRVLLLQERAGEASASIEEARRFWDSFAPQSRWAGEAAFWHAQILRATGKNAEARGEFARAATLLKNSPLATDTKLTSAALAASRG